MGSINVVRGCEACWCKSFYLKSNREGIMRHVCDCEGSIYLDFTCAQLFSKKRIGGEFCFDIFLCLGVF